MKPGFIGLTVAPTASAQTADSHPKDHMRHPLLLFPSTSGIILWVHPG
ncbi:MAG: hypothetical protein ACLQBA_09050 [Candidatus Binataceae bacterium]